MRYGGFLVTRIKQVSGRLLERMLAAKGVAAFNGPQGRILFVLWQKDGVPMSELSRQTGLATTSLTSMIDRMEESGLVRRERTTTDRRKVLIYLTDEARGLERDYDEVSDEMNAVFYEGFSETEAEQLDAYLNRVLANIEAHL
ncbi:MAG: MarR family transcriptional regulator [Atopobiaceae bacterium]|nr:MarR family transcriptional regulator [Atopobiaceae bacterium]